MDKAGAGRVTVYKALGKAVLAGILAAMLPFVFAGQAEARAEHQSAKVRQENHVPGKASRAARLAEAKIGLIPFEHSPFPYKGTIADTDRPFLDVVDDSRLGHTSARGGVYWEDETYSDRQVLIAFPKGFTLARPVLIVVYFHGNGATLERDVIDRQQTVKQVADSGLNAVLLAPQFARDAQDSSAGSFWTPGLFAQFLDEAASKMATLLGEPHARAVFARSPVVLAAYSGGYNPAAYAASVGGAGARLKGMILLDALYGETDRFAEWIKAQRKTAFFFSAYTSSSESENTELQNRLRDGKIAFRRTMPKRLSQGSIVFLNAGADASHDDFMTKAWVHEPLAWSLARIPGYRR